MHVTNTMTTVDIVLTGKRHEYYDDSSLCRSRIVSYSFSSAGHVSYSLFCRSRIVSYSLFCRSRLVSYSLFCRSRLVSYSFSSAGHVSYRTVVLQVTSRIVQLVLRVTSHIVQLFCRSRHVSYSLLREPRLVTVQVTSCIVQLVLRVTSGLVQLPVQCRCLCPPVKAAVKQCHVTHLLHV